VRLRSTANEPGPPLVFLAGGPGAPGIGMGRVPIYFRLFERLREVGDVILLDQRGTGLSSPNLSFPATASPPLDIFESEANWLRELTRQARASTDYWRSRGVDLSAYNSAQSADDLEDLRRALGAQKINLLGHSYGTELALAAVRRHPDRLDRLVLAGVHGPDDQQSLASVWDFVIRKLAVLAAADAQVGKDVPDLEGLFRRVLAKLERTPVTLTVTDERAKRPVRIRVGKIGLQWLVRMDMTDARTFARLPALLYAIDHGDYDAFARRMEPLYNAGLSRSAMAWAVDLSTGWSPERRLRAQREAAGAMFSNVNLQWTDEIRRIVGVADRGRELRARVWSVAAGAVRQRHAGPQHAAVPGRGGALGLSPTART
jgi:pimeloyl-ACP methyl ester carboxylesterase